MKPKMIALSPEVRDVLARSVIGSRTVRLPEQLDRTRYLAVDKALKAAGGKWVRAQGVHVFDRDPREALGMAIETGKIVNEQQTYQEFFTPPELAERMVYMAKVTEASFVLEPSAGEGALVIPCMELGASITCVEVQPRLCAKLRDEGLSDVVEGDFLTVELEPMFNAVVMNPPFSGDQDIIHVRKAYALLVSGGRLVAIMSTRFTWVQSALVHSFVAWLRDLEDRGLAATEALPRGTFTEAGTEVAAMLVTIRKP